MCDNCICQPVCAKYTATGGHVNKCEHFKEERKGKWVWKPTNYWTYILTCSLCSRTENAAEDCKYCPNCGADMTRGAEDG